MSHPAPQQMTSSHEDLEIYEKDPSKVSPLSIFLGIACCPLTLLGSWYTIQENEEVVILNFGKYTGTEKTAGIHFSNMWGREMRRVSKRHISVDLPNTKVVDRNGNPLVVSGIVVYRFVNTKRCALDVQNATTFVFNQSQAVMKQIVSEYPYENMTDQDHGACLKTEAVEISKRLIEVLQSKVMLAGAEVLSFQFNELSYAPEIASGMLKKQQAMATVAARKTIVDGAVEIAYGAIGRLEDKGIKMQHEEKTRLVSNLLTVICAEREVSPTLSVGQ